ncbi:MAG: hypothetical protein Q7S98_01265 [Deltaproteobacteria bacterium]|nr:hypothetical protein [Deltaproteobacteria bacterium]
MSGPYVVNPPQPDVGPLQPLQPNDDRVWEVVLRPITKPKTDGGTGPEERVYKDTDTVDIRWGETVETLRLLGINGSECPLGRRKGETAYQRCLRGEWGAAAGQKFTADFIGSHRHQLRLSIFHTGKIKSCHRGNIHKTDDLVRDSNCRLLGIAFVQEGETYRDVSAEVIAAGFGHPYVFWPDLQHMAQRYLWPLQEAQVNKRGLWGAEKKGVLSYRGPLYFTSYHPEATAKRQRPKDEYTRLFNISPQPVNLSDYVIEDVVTKTRYPLPDLLLPPAYGVKIFSNYDLLTADPNTQETFVNLNLGETQVGADLKPAPTSAVFWRNDSGLILRRKSDDQPITAVAAKGNAGAEVRKKFPEGFR